LIPYGKQGGNDTVDVRGKYTEITWSSDAAGDVSQDGLLKCLVMEMLTPETRYGNVMFSAYERSICSSSNVDFIKLVAEVNTSINQPFLRQNKAIINLIAFFC
jgi:hypothetical protein